MQSVSTFIEKEHEMFSSYVKTHHRFPNIVVSFLEQSSGLIHSCHFVLKEVTFIAVVFMMLVTYTGDGLRLSCAEFEGFLPIHVVQETRSSYLVKKHFRVSYLLRGVKLLHSRTTKNTQKEIKNNHMKLLRILY